MTASRGESPRSDEPVDPIAELGGTALRVYLYLLASNKPVGIRELQRALGFRSPSTARHHLERLVSLGLASRGVAIGPADPGGYWGSTYYSSGG